LYRFPSVKFNSRAVEAFEGFTNTTRSRIAII